MASDLPLKTPPQSICILRLSAIGDTTHVLPMIHTLQKTWPNCKITWIIGKTEASLVADIENVELIIFDKSKGISAYLTLYRILRNRSFDVLLHMQVALRANMASLLIKSPIKLGFDKTRAKDGQHLFTTHQIPSQSKQHVLDGFFEFIKALGINEKVLNWNISIPDEAIKTTDNILATDKPILAINPCSSSRIRNWRNWPAKHYVDVAEYAIETYGMHIVLTGGPAENEIAIAKSIETDLNHNITNLVGKTDLKTLAAVLQKADILIAPDTGPAHIATAVETPVIGLFASSNPLRTGPYNSQAWIVNRYPDALQAEYQLTPDTAPWGKRVRNPNVMEYIQTGDVIKKLDALMAVLGYSA